MDKQREKTIYIQPVMISHGAAGGEYLAALPAGAEHGVVHLGQIP